MTDESPRTASRQNRLWWRNKKRLRIFGLDGPDDAAGILADRGGRLLEFDDDLNLFFEGQLCQLATPFAFFPEDDLRGIILNGSVTPRWPHFSTGRKHKSELKTCQEQEAQKPGRATMKQGRNGRGEASAITYQVNSMVRPHISSALLYHGGRCRIAWPCRGKDNDGRARNR